jgi:Mn2+/Fe2+ NRAMP family transporter
VRTKTKNRGKSYDNKNKGFLARLGPGLITGASDDDPSGIGTYSQAGAQLGFGISWTMLLTYPLMAAIQEISARIGRVTGHGIAGNVCRHFPAPVMWSLVILLFIANTINVAADLGAMGDSLRLLVGGPGILYVVVFGCISVSAQIFLEYRRYVAILKWLTLTLFAYVAALAVVKVPWFESQSPARHGTHATKRLEAGHNGQIERIPREAPMSRNDRKTPGSSCVIANRRLTASRTTALFPIIRNGRS